jgi:hypothetical protein
MVPLAKLELLNGKYVPGVRLASVVKDDRTLTGCIVERYSLDPSGYIFVAEIRANINTTWCIIAICFVPEPVGVIDNIDRHFCLKGDINELVKGIYETWATARSCKGIVVLNGHEERCCQELHNGRHIYCVWRIAQSQVSLKTGIVCCI